jgi:hypothetical protein
MRFVAFFDPAARDDTSSNTAAATGLSRDNPAFDQGFARAIAFHPSGKTPHKGSASQALTLLPPTSLKCSIGHTRTVFALARRRGAFGFACLSFKAPFPPQPPGLRPNPRRFLARA